MEVVSICALRAGSVLWENAAGALTLTVVAKATYALRPGESPLATAQDAPTEADEHWNDDERRSLHAPSDLVPFKRRADILLVGHAFAPGGRPARSIVARLIVGEVDKCVEVFCERAMTAEGRLHEGPPLAKMPLRWERAAGGPDTANPAGVRPDGPRDAYGAVPLPSIQPHGITITSPGDYVAPVGFGPIAPSWPTRLARLSVSAAGWDFRRWRERRLPHDLDPAFFNVAPSDQQIDVIRPGERIVMENLHPDHARLVTSLAGATPRVTVEWSGAPSQELGMRCDTLLIDTDRGTCSITWRAQIPVDDPRRGGRVIITTTRPGGRPEETAKPRRNIDTVELTPPAHPAPPPPPAPPPAPPPPPHIPAPLTSNVEETIDGVSAGSLPALPFRVGLSALAGSVLGVPPEAQIPDLTFTESTDEQTSPTVPAASRDALPFGSGSAEGPGRTTLTTDLDLDEEETHTDLPRDLAQLVASAAAPAPATPPWRAEDMTAAPPQPEPDPSFETATLEIAPGRRTARATPPTVDPPATPPIPSPARPPVPPPAPPPIVAQPATPPPMIGPLATPEMQAAEAEAKAAPPEPEAPAAEPAPAPPPAPEPEPPLPLDAYPLERCAAIAASIARKKDETDRVLAEHDLAPDLWTKLDRHWTDHVRATSGRGRTAPLRAYDAAYVGQLEKERGPIRPDEYARLVVAVERASEQEELATLGLPRGALLRVQRVWLGRTAGDAELGKAVRRAIDAAREA